MRLCAEKVAGGYRLNGTKFWMSQRALRRRPWSSMPKTVPDGGSKRHHRLPGRKRLCEVFHRQKIDEVGMRGSPNGGIGLR